MLTINRARDALTRHSGLLLAASYLAAAIAALLPILLVEVPPLVDYPNHLARLHILAGYDSQPLLRQNYLVEWRWIPNLAIDGFATILTPLFSPMTVGRMFLALTVLMTAAGIIALHTVLFGRVGFWPLASFAMAYSLPFAWGLVNFQFSVGLCLLCCATWIASSSWHPLLRVALFNLAAIAVYFSHLFGYAVLVLVVGLYELGAAFRHDGSPGRPERLPELCRRLGVSAAAFAAPAILLLIGLLDREHGIAPLALGNWSGDVFSKLSALLAAMIFYGGAADLGLIIVVAALVAAALLTRGFALAPAFAWPLAGFLALTLATPSVFRGLFVDGRLGFVLGCLFVAAVNPAVTRPALRTGLYVALIGVMALKLYAIITIWQARESEYAAFRQTLQTVEAGSRILTVHDNGSATAEPSYSVHWNMSVLAMPARSRSLSWSNIETLAVIDRQVYSPVVFKNPSSQPLRSALQLRDIDPVNGARRVTAALFVAGATDAERIRRQATEHSEVAFWAGWPQRFDYIVVIRYPGVEPMRFEGLPLVFVAAKGNFEVYRVARPG